MHSPVWVYPLHPIRSTAEAADLSQRVSVILPVLIPCPPCTKQLRCAENGPTIARPAPSQPLRVPQRRGKFRHQKTSRAHADGNGAGHTKLERLMSGADTPASSNWVGEYCERLGEIRQRGCSLSGDQFCYAQVSPGGRAFVKLNATEMTFISRKYSLVSSSTEYKAAFLPACHVCDRCS